MHLLQGFTIKAHAKLNLSLIVEGKMDDEFHRIKSVICPISLNDTIEIKVESSSDDRILIKCEIEDGLYLSEQEIELLNSPQNLAYKAAMLILDRQESNFFIEIKIKKSIPTQAGLGGGSSDAASVLVALSKIFNFSQDPDLKLIDLASELGSDVVSQLFKKMIYVYGRGEKFSEIQIHPSSNFIEFLSSLSLVILKPTIGVNTSWAYKILNKASITEDNKNLFIGNKSFFEEMGLSISGFERSQDFKPKAANLDFLYNEFEAPIRANVQEVDLAFKHLENLDSDKVILAGSGSSVVGIFKDKFKAERSYEFLKANLGSDWFVKQSYFIP